MAPGDGTPDQTVTGHASSAVGDPASPALAATGHQHGAEAVLAAEPGPASSTGAEVAVPATSRPARWTPPTVGPQGDAGSPLNPAERNSLDEVIAAAERTTGLRFSVYLGDLGADPRATADGLLSGMGAEAAVAVLLAVSPGQRCVEIVTGGEAARRISDRSARLGALSVIAACSAGDLTGALVNGVRTLADQAGALPERSSW